MIFALILLGLAVVLQLLQSPHAKSKDYLLRLSCQAIVNLAAGNASNKNSFGGNGAGDGTLLLIESGDAS